MSDELPAELRRQNALPEEGGAGASGNSLHQDFWEAMRRADEAEAIGDSASALHILRSAQLTPPDMKTRSSQVSPHGFQLSIPVAPLVLQARAAKISNEIGQWSDSPRHGPDSDSPHGFLTLYESINPILPEQNHLLRFWMDRLRISTSAAHGRWFDVAAWALDLHAVCREAKSPAFDAKSGATEALLNLAVAMSHLGFKETAASLYSNVLGSDDLSTTSRAAALIRLGDLTWARGDIPEAEDHYSESIRLYQLEESRRINDVHNLIRALTRRADCRLSSRRFIDAAKDIFDAIELLESARLRGVYQSARSVDAAVRGDIAHLISYMARLPSDVLQVRLVVRALLILANSSAASRLRDGQLRAGAPSVVHVGVGKNSPTEMASIRSAAYWRPIADADVSRVFESDEPVLMCTMTHLQSGEASGISVLLGSRIRPSIVTWNLDEASSNSQLRLLRGLVQPPPGIGDTAAATGPWALPWSAEEMTELSSRLFPVDAIDVALTSRDGVGLQVIPVGDMWRFPFAAVAVSGEPLGIRSPFVVTPGPTRNTCAPVSHRWSGHFDLTLPAALADLKELTSASKASEISFCLFDDAEALTSLGEESPFSLLVFSGHGLLGSGRQALRMAGGRNCEASEFAGLSQGATVVLNACWSGYVFDEHGSDSSQQALEFLAAGAHSVLGTVGPINDLRAGQVLRELLPGLVDGGSMARSFRSGLRTLLTAEPKRPLSSWASFVTIGRSTRFVEHEGVVNTYDH